ncbi:uncharacterized protein LOC131237609 isoform X2 [Magnolia sinica]|uniref:uncharacterized protein LOC131237609 isoform X2 n=1 Tax=Magnolia sinica TaxID=86752 RepID=UPI002659C997|nr:uncharacterized protein LOC131237609 isoform X2 [Magnolia sinica]
MDYRQRKERSGEEMSVTHADLEIGRRSRDLGGKAGTAVIVLCLFCGLLAFVFCVLAERWRSMAGWVMVMTGVGKSRFECVYSGNGEIALLCGLGGFLTLAIAMIIQHAYMWVALVSSTSPRVGSSHLTIWETDSSTSLLAKQAAILFLTAWVCFGVAEVLLVIGVAVESNHLGTWREPRKNCLVVRHGSFLAAGIFDLFTVFLATAFYFVVLKMLRVREGEAAVQREVVEVALFSTPQSTLSDAVSPTHNSAVDLEGVVEESHARDRHVEIVKASDSREGSG